ncbi:MAG: ABC transporter ATP-binding protein [Mariprofundus sp.]|nr:ABC transporter ATP-binding protein [Mariprofundus sp.]
MPETSNRMILSSAEQSLVADAGALVVLTGDVGSGKTLWLKRMATLVALPDGLTCTMAESAPVVRMMFDRWPCSWLGQTVEEELMFGLKGAVSVLLMEETLRRWGLKGVALADETQSLNRLQSIRLSLAGIDLANPALVLLDNPSAALCEQMALDLSMDIAAWLKQTNTIVVVATNRWQDWQTVLTQTWHVESPKCLPEHVKY